MADDPKTVFHAPGSLSTWFKNLFRIPPPAEPVIPDLAERRALLEERARAEEQWDADRRAHDRRVEQARERAAEARAELQEAERVLGEAENVRLGAALNHGLRVDRLAARVRAGASRHLEVFMRDVRDQLAALGEAGVGVSEVWSRPSPIDGRREHRVFSNAASVAGRRQALVAALAAAEAMRLEPLEEETVIARLTALRDGIPAVEPHARPGADPLTPYERRQVQEARS
jgi:hypothetical protein